MAVALASAAVMLIAALPVVTLAQAQPGLWEISGAPGTRAAVRQCVTDVSALARLSVSRRPVNLSLQRRSTGSGMTFLR